MQCADREPTGGTSTPLLQCQIIKRETEQMSPIGLYIVNVIATDVAIFHVFVNVAEWCVGVVRGLDLGIMATL